MKKIISVLLTLSILAVCIVGSAVADDFSIRNGIKFGLNQSEVVSVEKENGIDLSEGGRESFLGDYQLYGRPDSLAGYSGYNYEEGHSRSAEIKYGFINDSLVKIMYRWESWCSSSDSTAIKKIQEQFGELNKSLSDKYMLIADSDKAGFSIIDLKPPVISYLDYAMNSPYTYGFSTHAFKQYLAVDGNKYVDIQLYFCSTKTLNGKTLQPEIVIEYTSVDSDEAEKRIKSI